MPRRCSSSNPSVALRHYQVIIIGGGIAALTAAIYTARAGLSTLVLDGKNPQGGLLTTTDWVENFPGYPTGISGYDLVNNTLLQAENLGAVVLHEVVDSVEHVRGFPGNSKGFNVLVRTLDLEKLYVSYTAPALILATGSIYKKLEIPGADSKKVLWCSVCDGPLYKGKTVAVVGGGETALTEALHLSKIVKSVVLIHRRSTFRASAVLAERVLEQKNIKILLNTEITSVKETKTGLKLTTTDPLRPTLDPAALFVAIGLEPQSQLVSELVDTENGFVVTFPDSTRTKTPGLFVAGDVADNIFRQAITAAGSGCKAGMEATWYLGERSE